ncbi:MAG: tRNA 4-thiouridine(8) synthase ThiI [Clostridiales Family XIII bacterium]|jgi:thiamine biosynthesis protein ThiI|nr:tRNA 4-thiouridine(8) synthase ThiI [Clostridiales Family XIII bacterium]
MEDGKKIYIIRLAEAFLKGKNKPFFEGKIIQELKNILGNSYDVYRLSGLLIVKSDNKNIDGTEVVEIKKVFGIASISPAYEFSFEKKLGEEEIIKTISNSIEKLFFNNNKQFTIKIETKRRDKTFPLSSVKINSEIGHFLLINNKKLKVDIHNPEKIINIEIRKNSFFIYDKIIEGQKGLPKGTSGSGISLISGGIDSPVATYLMAKRGMKITAIHFHSYPYTSDRAKEKVKILTHILSNYLGKFEIYIINILPYQEEIRKCSKPENMTIHTRRAMIKLASFLAEEKKSDALITGESLGQVASQTAEAISVTDEIANLPILRPLIAMEKTEIIDIARDIKTFEISIKPYEDCCQVFLPKHPNTKPKLSKILEEEKKLNRDKILKELFMQNEVAYSK